MNFITQKTINIWEVLRILCNLLSFWQLHHPESQVLIDRVVLDIDLRERFTSGDYTSLVNMRVMNYIALISFEVHYFK